MKAYQCSMCEHIQETRGPKGMEDEYLDVCLMCESVESLKEIQLTEEEAEFLREA